MILINGESSTDPNEISLHEYVTTEMINKEEENIIRAEELSPDLDPIWEDMTSSRP